LETVERLVTGQKFFRFAESQTGILEEWNKNSMFHQLGNQPNMNETLARFATTTAISVLHCFSSETSGEVLASICWIRRSNSAGYTKVHSDITALTG